ncbi:hypothetical protein EJ03DRAFT_323191 [Teratosphaeria nubilosa]|uniref:Tim44-like domain-containing protein n=1 Tax=Teratosphaeria nubilosa TaxID=161662 RepID=A0A6G1LLS6_9PEZI|nr:hypothetical protein EJ03DRAFT_323191 [Teratosphaeria nubilosa]
MAPSIAVKMKEQQKKALAGGELPDDVGLLPQTMVMPSSSKRPSWFKDGGNRWRMEKARIKTRFYEFASAMAYRWFMVRPRPSLDYFKTTTIAKELHSEIYKHFAAGNLAPVEHKLVDGMKSSLRGRLAQRAPNMSLKWTLHNYLSKPKLMSYKAVLFPGHKGQSSSEANAVIQAVVRIHSQQSLQHVKKISMRDARNRTTTREVITDASGAELNEAEMKPRMKDAVEYVVIQRSLRQSKECPWTMWGTTEELTMDRLKKDEKQSEKEALGQLAG